MLSVFFSDFSLAEIFGADAIQEAYDEAIETWGHNAAMSTVFEDAVKQKILQHTNAGNVIYTHIYERLFHDIKQRNEEAWRETEFSYVNFKTTD